MALSIVMPALEMAQETGTVIAWRKREGERVAKGEPLLEVETDKAVVEIESPGDGILAAVTAPPGTVVPVGQTIAWLVQPGETPPTAAPAVGTGRRSGAGAATVSSAAAASRPAEPPTPADARISPKARRLAREHGVDIAALRGSGPGGEVLAADVLAAAAHRASPAAPASAPADVWRPGTVGRLMAERTAQSWTTMPHFFVTREMDAGALLEAHRQPRPAAGPGPSAKPTLTDWMIALVARVLRQHPRINGSWQEGAIRLNPDVNVAVAVAVEEGVVAPVIHRADTAGLSDIAARRQALTERARAGRLQPADIAGATFTISNLGMYAVDSFTAIVVPPQAAILALGRIADRVVAVDGRPAVQSRLTATLSCDHRVADGARAALFLNDLAGAFARPGEWLK